MNYSGDPPSRIGQRLLVGALVGLGLWVLASVGWIVWKAIENPDVRARRPSWLPPDQAFDASFWIPLFLTVAVGSVLVGWIFWRAYQRMREGEDVYGNRYGRGQRRRGERRIVDAPARGAGLPQPEKQGDPPVEWEASD